MPRRKPSFLASEAKPIAVKDTQGKLTAVFNIARAYPTAQQREQYLAQTIFTRPVSLTADRSTYDFVRCMECMGDSDTPETPMQHCHAIEEYPAHVRECHQ